MFAQWKPLVEIPHGGFLPQKVETPSMLLAIKWGVSTSKSFTRGFPLEKLAGPYVTLRILKKNHLFTFSYHALISS